MRETRDDSGGFYPCDKVIEACQMRLASIKRARRREYREAIEEVLRRRRLFGLLKPYTVKQAIKVIRQTTDARQLCQIHYGQQFERVNAALIAALAGPVDDQVYLSARVVEDIGAFYGIN